MAKKLGNFLDLVPEINCPWETDREGRIYLLVPRFKNPWMKKIVSILGRSEKVRIFLDEIGSRSWSLINGQRNIQEIGMLLEKEMGETINPVYERLSEFMSILFRNQFIVFKNY